MEDKQITSKTFSDAIAAVVWANVYHWRMCNPENVQGMTGNILREAAVKEADNEVAALQNLVKKSVKISIEDQMNDQHFRESGSTGYSFPRGNV